MPRVGRPSSVAAIAPPMLTVSALAVPIAANNRAIYEILRRLSMFLLHLVFIFRVLRL
jgi:hypothetical protein